MTMRSHADTARLAAERKAEIERLRPTDVDRDAASWAVAVLQKDAAESYARGELVRSAYSLGCADTIKAFFSLVPEKST